MFCKQERALRQRLEKDVQSARNALKKREEEEQAAANKAMLLAEELERQHLEQSDTAGLIEQVHVREQCISNLGF